MKAVQIFQPHDLRVIDEKNNVLIKIKTSAICGSDKGICPGTHAAYPRVIGHEIVGERITIDRVTACGHCRACRHGREHVPKMPDAHFRRLRLYLFVRFP